MADKKELATVEQAIKKTGRGGKYNFPSSVPPESPEDVTRVLGSVLRWYDRGSVKAVSDDDVEQRTREYFQFCFDNHERPTVESYALALGYTRDSLNRWEHGDNASARRQDIIKRAKEVLASYDAGMVTAGKMNPVPYIFRAKNYYGMRDQIDITATPGANLGEKTPDQIAADYVELPED